MKTQKTYGRWTCAKCGDFDGLGGGILEQYSETRAIAGRCRWCEQSRVLVKRGIFPPDKTATPLPAVPMTATEGGMAQNEAFLQRHRQQATPSNNHTAQPGTRATDQLAIREARP